MAERKFSCIKEVVQTVKIPVPATFISNEISGIAEILEGWKCQYSKELQGVVVNYKQFSLSSRTGFMAPNSPYVYYNVKASFDLFCPKVGDIIKGKIFKIFKGHIVCLIADTINVSIHLSSDSPRDLAPFICSDREILFEISSFSCGAKKALNVTGKITHKCIQLMREFFPPQTFSSLVDSPEFSNNTDEGIGTSSESVDDGLMDTSDPSTGDEMPKKKKRRKDKTVPLEEKEIKNELSDVPDNETVSAAVLSLKREISSPEKTDSDFVPESMMKKKSKDKKSKKKDKSKKKKGKILASGTVLNKDKTSRKKGSKKNKLDGEQSKKHKKSKSHKKDRKKKAEGSKTNIFDVIKSEID